MLMILSGFIVFGRGFIYLWAGPDYGESYIITLIFFISLFIPLIQNVGISILQARNQLKFRSISYVCIAFISVGCQIWLSSLFGTVGCAIAIGAALFVGQGVVMNIYYAIRQHLDIVLFWKEIGRMMLIPFVLTILGLLSQRYFNYTNIYILCIGIIVFCLIYTPLFYSLSMNDYERNLLKVPLLRLCHRLR